MSAYSFYRLADGLFTGTVADIPESALARHLRAGVGAMPGVHDCKRRRVDLATGTVVDYVPPQPADTEWETWRLEAGAWVARPTEAALWRAVRAERDRRLATTDWIVARATEAGEPVPIEWREYRQALRDVTKQPDPAAIDWPEAP